MLRGLCDDVLSGEDEAYPIAYVIASLIEVIEHIKAEVAPPDPSSHETIGIGVCFACKLNRRTDIAGIDESAG